MRDQEQAPKETRVAEFMPNKEELDAMMRESEVTGEHITDVIARHAIAAGCEPLTAEEAAYAGLKPSEVMSREVYELGVAFSECLSLVQAKIMEGRGSLQATTIALKNIYEIKREMEGQEHGMDEAGALEVLRRNARVLELMSGRSTAIEDIPDTDPAPEAVLDVEPDEWGLESEGE